MDDGDYNYKLITEKHISKTTEKICTKVYHIIYSIRRSTYVEFKKIRFSLLWFFGDLLWFFKDLVKIKNKIKIEKLLPPHPQTALGGYLNGFVSLRRLNGWFYDSERKSKFDSKLR